MKHYATIYRFGSDVDLATLTASSKEQLENACRKWIKRNIGSSVDVDAEWYDEQFYTVGIRAEDN